MSEIRQYGEEFPATIKPIDDHKLYGAEEGRLVIEAINEGGFNCTLVDLEDVIRWTAENHPDMLLRTLYLADNLCVDSLKIDEVRGEGIFGPSDQ